MSIIIDNKYQASLGAPTSAEGDAMNGGRYRHYQNGSIYYHPASGSAAFIIRDVFRAKYESLGWERGVLGYPVMDAGAARGGTYQHFMGGSLYHSAATGVRVIYGPIWHKWQTMGWESGAIGYPSGDPIVQDGQLLRQTFTNGAMTWSPGDGVRVVNAPPKITKQVKVFLVDFQDAQAPAGFSREFFDRYFFSDGGPFNNPLGEPIPQSLFQYFFNISNGYFRIAGNVAPWTRSNLNVTGIAHWRDGVTVQRNLPDIMSATLVAALRGNNIRRREDLYVNGVMPDTVVLLNIDIWAGGGATRSFRDVKGYLTERNLASWWDAAWDAFLDIPITATSLTRHTPNLDNVVPQGTFNASQFAARNLSWAKSDALAHELVHALTAQGWDLYNPEWGWSSSMELMAFSVGTDHPVYMNSYLRERNGWINMDHMPRRTHRGLKLGNYETTSHAYRFQQGPMMWPEELIVENRLRIDYSRNPPQVLDNGLLAFRLDQHRRLAGNMRERRYTFPIQGSHQWREFWGVPGAPAALSSTGDSLGNSLNYAGECWWEFVNIRQTPGRGLEVDANFIPRDLLATYNAASWANGAGTAIAPDTFMGSMGQVMMMNTSGALDARMRYRQALSLHPQWVPNGSITGTYTVSVPAAGARLYLTAILSEEAAGSDGVTVTVTVPGTPFPRIASMLVNLERNVRTLSADLSAFRGTNIQLQISCAAGANANRDWIHIVEAVIVPTAPTLSDIAASAGTARWTTRTGAATPQVADTVAGAVGVQPMGMLQNGMLYSGRILITKAAAADFVEGTFTLSAPLPASNCVLRAELGYAPGNGSSANANVTIRFVPANGSAAVPLTTVTVSRYPLMGTTGEDRNPSTTLAVVIPSGARNRAGSLVVRVEGIERDREHLLLWSSLKVCQY